MIEDILEIQEKKIAALWTPERLERELARRPGATLKVRGFPGDWYAEISGTAVPWPTVWADGGGPDLGEVYRAAFENYDAEWNRARLIPPPICHAIRMRTIHGRQFRDTCLGSMLVGRCLACDAVYEPPPAIEAAP